MSQSNHDLQVRSVVAGLEHGDAPAPGRDSALRALDAFIGKWITTGHTVQRPGVPSAEILASDVYEWAPGGFFVVHSAYGRIGEVPVGGIEILSYDVDSGQFCSRFFDSQGNATESQLTLSDGVWTWIRDPTRCFASFSTDGTTQTAHHEICEDGVNWQPSMEVTLRKIN